MSDNESALLIFKRRGARTWVYLGEDLLGRIDRREVSNASPRGGAYRTAHFAMPLTGEYRKRGVECYTRKEAAEWLLARTQKESK
jgi:hypothetical protein